MNPDELFAKLDKNNDGAVDLAEYSDPQKAEIEGRFKRADENNDGKISKEELKSATERMRSMMRRGPGGGPGGQGGPGGFRGGPGGPGGEGNPNRPRPESEGDAPKKDTSV